jgi:hypothetical protein
MVRSAKKQQQRRRQQQQQQQQQRQQPSAEDWAHHMRGDGDGSALRTRHSPQSCLQVLDRVRKALTDQTRVASPTAFEANVIVTAMMTCAGHPEVQVEGCNAVVCMMQKAGPCAQALAQGAGVPGAVLSALERHPTHMMTQRMGLASLSDVVVGGMWPVLTPTEQQRAARAAEAAYDAAWDGVFGEESEWETEVRQMARSILHSAGRPESPDRSGEEALQANLQLYKATCIRKVRAGQHTTVEAGEDLLRTHGYAPTDVFLRKMQRLFGEGCHDVRQRQQRQQQQQQQQREAEPQPLPEPEPEPESVSFAFASENAYGKGSKQGKAAFSPDDISESRKQIAKGPDKSEGEPGVWYSDDLRELLVAVQRIKFELKESLAHHGEVLEEEWCALPHHEQTCTLRAVSPFMPESKEKPKVKSADGKGKTDMSNAISRGVLTLKSLRDAGLVATIRKYANLNVSAVQDTSTVWMNINTLGIVVCWFYDNYLPYENVNLNKLMHKGPFQCGERFTEGELRRRAVLEMRTHAKSKEVAAADFDRKWGVKAKAAPQPRPAATARDSSVPAKPAKVADANHAEAQRQAQVAELAANEESLEQSRRINVLYKEAKISSKGITSLKKLAEAVKPHGWTGPHPLDGGHKQFRRPGSQDSGQPVTVSSTPSDGSHGWGNVVSQFNKYLRTAIERKVLSQ